MKCSICEQPASHLMELGLGDRSFPRLFCRECRNSIILKSMYEVYKNGFTEPLKPIDQEAESDTQ